MYDVIIIGAGVSGCAIARELSKKKLKIAVLEKCSDVCEGTSKANSGIVHAGYDAKPGTLKAKLNVRGSRMMPALSKELDFAYEQLGSLVFCFDEGEKDKLTELYQRGLANGVEGLTILDREQVLKMEPQAGDDVVAALYAPTGAVVCPFELTVALAESAVVNGAEFYLQTEVKSICRLRGSDGKDLQPKQSEKGDEREKSNKYGGYKVLTNKGEFTGKVVINAAGVYADVIHNMVANKEDEMKITPRKGEYLLCDKKVGNMVKHTIFQLPTALGKGVLVTPTVHGNLLMGPTAEDVEEKEDVSTSQAGLLLVQDKAGLSMKEVPAGQVITSFSGLRANAGKGDFIIGEAEGAPGFIDVAGIESPGLSCAPAIGEYVADIVEHILEPEDNAAFISERKGIPHMAMISDEEKQRLIEENPAYANVVCRCEMITEGEIVAAIHRPLGATTVDGIKRRTRAGMGRCQAGFCLPKTIEILARELGRDESEIRKAQEGAFFFTE